MSLCQKSVVMHNAIISGIIIVGLNIFGDIGICSVHHNLLSNILLRELCQDLGGYLSVLNDVIKLNKRKIQTNSIFMTDIECLYFQTNNLHPVL